MNPYLALVIGFVAGVVICGVLVVKLMPGMMIVKKKSLLGFEETVNRLEQSVKDNGWVAKEVWHLNQSMAKHNVEFKPRVSLVKLCKPQYAKEVLTTDRHISCLMPCTMAVWEDDHGGVWFSEMNMALMAKLFGGNIARVMGGAVVAEEKQMLKGIIED